MCLILRFVLCFGPLVVFVFVAELLYFIPSSVSLNSRRLLYSFKASMICFQTSGVGVNDLFRNNSLSKGTTLVLDSFEASAVDDFGSSSSPSSLLLIMLDLSMSASMRKPSEYRLAFTSASAMLLSTCFTISEVVSFDLIIC